MSQLNAFYPQGNTVAVLPTASNQAITLTGAAGANTMQVRVVNKSTQDIFLNFGGTAVVPTPGSPAAGLCVASGAVEVFTISAGISTVGVIQATAGTGNAYFTQGEGV